MPAWFVWMRKKHPELGLHVETDCSERLTDYVQQGFLNLAITHMPKALPGLIIEDFTVDRLVLVSSEPRDFASCQNSDYLHVDWSYGYRAEHLEKVPGLQASRFNIGFGEIALEYLLIEGGFAYLPAHSVSESIDKGQLHVVKDAPELSRPSCLVYSKKAVNPDRIKAEIEGLYASVETKTP